MKKLDWMFYKFFTNFIKFPINLSSSKILLSLLQMSYYPWKKNEKNLAALRGQKQEDKEENNVDKRNQVDKIYNYIEREYLPKLEEQLKRSIDENREEAEMLKITLKTHISKWFEDYKKYKEPKNPF